MLMSGASQFLRIVGVAFFDGLEGFLGGVSNRAAHGVLMESLEYNFLGF